MSAQVQLLKRTELSPAPRSYDVRYYSPKVKRTTDLVFVLASLPLWLPLCIVIYAIVAVTSSGPVFFRQRRIGLHGVSFKVWKFRTMRVDAEEHMATVLEANPGLREEWDRNHKLRDDPRVTAIGRLLRKTSLDELPQLFNVLSGKMSLVGPRPLPEYHISEAPDEFSAVRQTVLPGLTGLWQVKGRRGAIEEVMKYDTEYLRQRGFLYDLVMLVKTVFVVVRSDGAA